MNPNLNTQAQNPSTAQAGMPVSLATQLRESSMQAHKNAEGASFVKKLFKGECSNESYAQYLWALREVYSVLENLLNQHQDQKQIKPVYYTELFRTAALETDLQQWSQELKPASPALQKAVQNYQNRLTQVAQEKPYLLVSHSYVRFLGDLSGGQMLGKVLNARWPGHPGLNFYQYDFSDFTERKNQYRAQLDLIGVEAPQLVSEICEEAVHAFELNEGLFSALSEAQ